MHPTDDHFITQALQKAIQAQVDSLVTEALEEAKRKLEARVREKVPVIVATVFERFTFEGRGCITVDFRNTGESPRGTAASNAYLYSSTGEAPRR